MREKNRCKLSYYFVLLITFFDAQPHPVSMEKPRDARLVSRVFAAPRSQSWAKTRHVISGAIQEVQWLSRLSKHIYLRGKDLFVNL